MYLITFNNCAGELDRRTASTPEQAAKEAISMLEEAGALYNGDNITVQGEDGDE